MADSNSKKSKGNKTDDSEKPNIVQLSEEYVQHVKGQANMITDAVRSLDIENSQNYIGTTSSVEAERIRVR
ncbi:hypothetical protein CASFOL_033742 [Castilleja foliolosa]|uniref:Uncharacterized protein n=1 Tax=Castilleja foliolosa TaxID=1961234 RepID=A0ABD3BZG8_9LAMI